MTRTFFPRLLTIWWVLCSYLILLKSTLAKLFTCKSKIKQKNVFSPFYIFEIFQTRAKRRINERKMSPQKSEFIWLIITKYHRTFSFHIASFFSRFCVVGWRLFFRSNIYNYCSCAIMQSMHDCHSEKSWVSDSTVPFNFTSYLNDAISWIFRKRNKLFKCF